MVRGLVCIVYAAMLGAAGAAHAGGGFSFSEEDAKQQAESDAAATRIQDLVDVPCQTRLKNQKIMTLIAERQSDGWQTRQDRYGPMFRAIDMRLRALGLHPYTQDEIKAQIAQAEIDAYFRNDPDAALSASRRLGAGYILRGEVTSQSAINPVLHINEVAVEIGLTLSAASGRVISDVGAHSTSYSGTDTLAMALTLVNEQADRLVAKLYNDYCRGAEHRN